MIDTLITNLFQKLLSFLSDLFTTIFGTWNYQILFSWLPSDILAAAQAFILVLFGIAVLRILRDLLPF